ncbi:SDR family oxidoreductase [Mycobacterium crocinum]|uniref:SDR family oxidoreductase n=1 Tax=Mycolicibacterium crocinum TaxID=388459 RepID=A0ABY3TNT6_9MYCO|nr:SDR family oxidoreductase [Mycolicibacterium crocinum]MCV7215627.1 SDR family oxidoreductase [Mycolicibacterium crocinum]ULN43051.1 SDR family oxidoreductase [Mycolicibacterium crocinum]
MRITVFGATGQIGRQVVELLTGEGHDVVAASRQSGVDVLTSDGVADAVRDTHVLVDVLNSPSYEDEPVLEFFGTATRTLVAAARTAGVGHYVALSIVGVTRLPTSGYMRAKVAQETLIEASGLPYTIVRATQFIEFADMIVASLTDGDVVRVPDARIQPIAASEVAAHVARAAVGSPVGIVELGGPDTISFAELAEIVLARRGEQRTVVVDPDATYFGARVDDTSLVTGAGAVLGTIRLT